MNSQGDVGHHFPLSPPDLVTHMDERDTCFYLDPDDPVFFGTTSSTCVYVFPITLHCIQIAFNSLPRL